MDDIDRSTNYFELFNLPMQNSKKSNYKTLQDRLKKLNDRRDENGINLQRLANKAMQIFNDDKDDTEHNEYLEYWKGKEQGTGDTKKQKQIEEELRKLKEAQQRDKTDAEAAKRRAEKAQAEAEEAKRQTAQAEQRTRETQQKAAPPLKTDWHKLGNALKGQLNLPEDGVRATALDLLASRLSNKQTQASQPSINQQPTINQRPINLSGNWRDVGGTLSSALNYSITHSGSWLKMQGKKWGVLVLMEGEGIVSGQVVRIDEYKVATGVTGQLDLEISADGRSLKGTGTNFLTGLTHNVHFARI